MTKNILAILAHPLRNSLCGDLHKGYISTAKQQGHNVTEIVLSELKFDPILHKAYKEIQPLESDLVKAQELIKSADHLVLTFPTWWGTYPAILKGFLDRCIIPGFAYKFHKNKYGWDKLLTKKSGRLIVTMDGPYLYNKFFIGAAGITSIKSGVLEFCGIKPVRVSVLDRVKFRTQKDIANKVLCISDLGRKGL